MHAFRAFSSLHSGSASFCGAVFLVCIACGGAPASPSSDPSGLPGTGGSSSTGVQLTDDFGGRRLLPDDNWWNVDLSGAPVDPQSGAYVDYIGRSRTAHPDFGPPPYGIPYVGLGGDQPRVPVTFTAYGSESDSGFGGEAGYPIPPAAATQPNYIEGGVPGGGSSGDRHLLIVDRDRWLLFDLSSNARRPEGWTSADAAGLAILPGLVRVDEAMRGPIRHALRVTVRSTNGYVWPASHRAGSSPGALPMGARPALGSLNGDDFEVIRPGWR